MKQKMHITNSIIRAGIAYAFYLRVPAYAFYVVPFSYSTIKKLDKHIIRLYKNFYGLPNNTPNITTQLLHELFGIKAFSLTNVYLRCISEQLRDVFNDLGQLGKMYQGLTHYTIAKHGGAQSIPRITNSACACSSITQTLYLLKTIINTHTKH